MQLPEIPLPIVVPFEIPTLLHPVAAHFGVVLPVVILIIELLNLYYKRRALSVASLLLFILMGMVYVGLFVTGTADGKEAYELLSEQGQLELKEHKTLGIYLVYLSTILLIVKMLAMSIQKKGTKIALFVSIVIFMALVLVQGKHGGELVYEYGANVEATTEAQDALDTMQDEMDELKTQMQTLQAEANRSIEDHAKAVISKRVDEAKAAIGTEVAKAVESVKETLNDEQISKLKHELQTQVSSAMERIKETVDHDQSDHTDAETPAVPAELPETNTSI